MHWQTADPAGILTGLFVGGASGLNLFGAYFNGIIGSRGGFWNRKKSPVWFWIGTSVFAFVFGLIGVGVFLIGTGAPVIPSVATGITIGAVVLIAIVRNNPT